MSSQRVRHKLRVARTLAATGMFRPSRPDRIVRSLLALRQWGATPAAGYTSSSARYPKRLAIVDDAGSLTFGEVQRRTNSLAHGLAAHGLDQSDNVAIMCRNHRGFVEATVACSKLGLSYLYLNTAFAGPQIAEVLRDEAATALIYDEEFAGLLGGYDVGKRFVAWSEEPGSPLASAAAHGDPSLEQLIGEYPATNLEPPPKLGRVVILTSGTTGVPKGAARHHPDSLDPAAALFSKIPLRAREATMIAAPMFHSWGLAHFTLGLPLSSTLVLRRRFDPEETLAVIAENRVSALVVVPVMLQRMIELPPETLARHDTSSLRVIAVSGSALPGELATRVLDTFGEVLYNLYGSTEVAWATIATPADLRSAQGTAGRPPLGTTVMLLDRAGRPVPKGASGRIFVTNEMVFEGYTAGDSKEMVAGLMSTGDVGHFDEQGRLFVDGRDDEMIISGGENVFPREVEDLLAAHIEIEEVAVIGVHDEEFGQRLKAFVVPRPQTRLDSEQVKEYVKDNLARFKVPREVVLVERLPRTATGKILKRELEDVS